MQDLVLKGKTERSEEVNKCDSEIDLKSASDAGQKYSHANSPLCPAI